MTPHDLYLLSPEIALVGLAGVVVLLDLVLRSKRVLAVVAVVGLLVPVALSVMLWGDVHASPDGRMTGIFGTLVVDKFALFFKFLVLAVVALVVMGSADYVGRFQRAQGEFYALVLFSASGMMLMAASTELVTIYVSLELATLPMAALAAFLRDERSSEAGIKFLLLSAMSSALLLYGMVLIYGFTGSTQLEEIARVVSMGDTPFDSNAMLAGIALMVAGFGFKISMVPFQMWAPDVYEGSPTPVVAYLSVASKAAGFALLLRVFYVAFGSVNVDWGILFAVLSALTMTIGNLVAIAQSNVKRLLFSGLGSSGVLFYLGAYAVTNLAAFFSIMVIINKTGSEQIDAFAGMAGRAPVVAAVLALALVSLIGIPPTAGFMGKLYLFNAAVRGDLAWLALVAVINSVVSAYYYLRIVRTMYLNPLEFEDRVSSSTSVRFALGITAFGILVIGIVPGPLLEFTETAVRTLLP